MMASFPLPSVTLGGLCYYQSTVLVINLSEIYVAQRVTLTPILGDLVSSNFRTHPHMLPRLNYFYVGRYDSNVAA